MQFAALPPDQRPRERLAKFGADSLSVPELLALQLRSGTHGASASDLAERLLAEFGDLRRITIADLSELERVPGIGRAKSASVIAGFELARRAAEVDDEAPVLRRASDVAAVASREIGHARRERVLVLVCDRQGRLLRTARLTEGTDRRSLIEVREVLNAVLRYDGASFALAHNHPSGDPTPSDADLRATEAVACGAKTVGLRFLGHVIVGAADDMWTEVQIKPVQRTPD